MLSGLCTLSRCVAGADPVPLFTVPGGVTVQTIASAPHLLMYAESGVANRMVFRFLVTSLKIKLPSDARPLTAYHT